MCQLTDQTMECHPDKMHVDFLLKSISDLILQEFKAMRQDVKIEFAQLQVNMEDIVSKILSETKKAETINRAIQINKTSQALDVESDIGICIKEVYSQNASVFPLVEAVKEEPLLLQHWEFSEKDDLSISMPNKFSHQSEVEVNAVVQTVDPQTCIGEDHSEKASVYPQFEVIEEEPLLLQKYEVSQTEIDDPNISMLNNFSPQSENGVNATVKIVKPQSCVARNSDEEFSDSVEMNLNKSTAMEIINACKDDAQLVVGNNEEKHFSCNFCDRSFKCKRNLKVHLRTHTVSHNNQAMECDPGIIQVDVLLKAISDLISQELKSLRQEMKMEFAQLQVNIEDMVLKILAETKQTETMNNAIPIEEISQPLHVESYISLKIEDVYSEKAPVFPLVEAIKEGPLLLEEYEL
ncbi:unnamed protein product [Clavelina lepadiformis]|uniref:C2H2-type domain-containing protein n=1 Tax=Clavelina lepadiformis TaxID=159417 RepID=A0ABP0GLE1_CLALP